MLTEYQRIQLCEKLHELMLDTGATPRDVIDVLNEVWDLVIQELRDTGYRTIQKVKDAL